MRATDAAGNTGPAATYAWTIDTVAPTTTIDSGPPELTNDSSASFEFHADEPATFECRLDGGDWGACAARTTNLADGLHTFQVRATDAAGNLGAAATYSWTIDTVAPTTTIDAGPDDPTNQTSATFEFSADEPATFECRLDGGDWGACEPYTNLADGRHTFQVRATDAAGNPGPAASYSWTIDTVAPVTRIIAAPADPSNVSSATFAFSADEDATFECRLDDGDWAACTSPQSYTGLADRRHSFDVRATDPAGNEGAAASYSWTVDAAAPTTTIDAGPDDPTNQTSATFEFHADEQATFECRLDGGDWGACEPYTNLLRRPPHVPCPRHRRRRQRRPRGHVFVDRRHRCAHDDHPQRAARPDQRHIGHLRVPGGRGRRRSSAASTTATGPHAPARRPTPASR